MWWRQRAGTRTHVRHRAVDTVAEAFSRRAQVVASGSAQHALAADLGGGLADDAIPFAEAANAAAEPGDGAAELVAEDDRNVDRPRMGLVRLVDVRSTHRHRADLEQDLAFTHLGHRDLAQFDGERFERVVDDGGVCWHRSASVRSAAAFRRGRPELGNRNVAELDQARRARPDVTLLRTVMLQGDGAAPECPGSSALLMTVWPLRTTVSRLPRIVISNVFHSPMLLSAFFDGVTPARTAGGIFSSMR